MSNSEIVITDIPVEASREITTMFDCDVLEVSLISSASASETSVALKKRIAHP
jgi:hypothetical protein